MALKCLTRLKINQQNILKICVPLSCVGSRNFAIVHEKKSGLPSNNWNQFQFIRTRYDKSGKSSSDGIDDEDVSFRVFRLFKTSSIKFEFQADEDDFGNDQEKKNIVKYSMQSMRTDLLLKQALGIARNKIELAFYEGKIRVNGKKIQKKSHTIHVGDEIDLIKGNFDGMQNFKFPQLIYYRLIFPGESPNNSEHLVISRIEIMSAVPKDESIAVTMKRFKQMLVDKYKDH